MIRKDGGSRDFKNNNNNKGWVRWVLTRKPNISVPAWGQGLYNIVVSLSYSNNMFVFSFL